MLSVKMRFSIALIFALSSIVSAAPAPQATSTCTEEAAATTSAAPITLPTAPYGVMSIRSGSPVHLLPMQARGQNFYLGGSPATYCPQPPVTECPSGLDTVFAGLGALVGFHYFHGPGQILIIGQDVLVPGGQLIYVRRDGSLGFTQAHSASYPTGAIIGGHLNFVMSEGAQVGTLGTQAFGAKGFMACPTENQGYQVFAAMSNATAPGGDLAACLGFEALTIDEADPTRGAWQYI
jgi:hypothetical protein